MSLLNADTEILAKVLAMRLEKALPAIIHSDHNGFVQNRQRFHNIRSSQYTCEGSPNIAILSLDAEKAFDCIEWRYVLEVLGRFGVGNFFCKWVEIVFVNSTVMVSTNIYDITTKKGQIPKGSATALLGSKTVTYLKKKGDTTQ